MINVRGMINRAKSDFKGRQTVVRQKKAVSQAKKLEELRRARLAEEGMAKLYKAEEKERSRIAKAKAVTRSHSKTARAAKALGKLRSAVRAQAADRRTNPYQLGGGPQYGPTGGKGPGLPSNTGHLWGGRPAPMKKKKQAKKVTIILK